MRKFLSLEIFMRKNSIRLSSAPYRYRYAQEECPRGNRQDHKEHRAFARGNRLRCVQLRQNLGLLMSAILTGIGLLPFGSLGRRDSHHTVVKGMRRTVEPFAASGEVHG